jgi:hypothetical protein
MSLWKKVLAVVIFLCAVVFAVRQWNRLFPPQTNEAPKAVQAQKQFAQNVEDEFRRNIRLMNLGEEKEDQLQAWSKEKPKTKEARREKNKRLREILTPEQIKELKEYQQLRNNQMKALQGERKARMVRMVGAEDAARLAEDHKKIKEQRKQRLAAQQAQEARE